MRTYYKILLCFTLICTVNVLRADLYFSLEGSSSKRQTLCGTCGATLSSIHSSCGACDSNRGRPSRHGDSRHGSPFYTPEHIFSQPTLMCQYCGFHNITSNRLCGGCRRSIRTSMHTSMNYCHSCNQNYASTYQSCPSCYSGYTAKKNKSKKKYRSQHFSPVLLGELYQNSNEKNQFVTNVSHLTHAQPFNKVIISVDSNGQSPILNTIKVKVNHSWLETNVGSRLREGEQYFAVHIPQYASEIVCSFKHGKGSSVRLWIE